MTRTSWGAAKKCEIVPGTESFREVWKNKSRFGVSKEVGAHNSRACRLRRAFKV